MNTDGRYMYNSAQPMATTYDYAPYPTSAYDTTQIPPQPQVRSMRQTPSQPHSPHQPQPPFNSPPAQYPPQPSPYVTPSHPHAHPQYAMPPPPAAQWTQESWNHYNQYQQPPIPDVGFQSGPGRPEPPSNPAPPPPAPPSDQRSYAPSQTSPDVRHDEEHYVLTPVAMAPSKPPRRRDKDTPSSTQSPSTPSVLDFAKLLESYQFIIDASTTLNNTSLPPPPGRPPPAETMDRMLQSAAYGAQMLDTAAVPSSAAEMRPPSQVSVEDSPDPVASSTSKQSKAAVDDDGTIQEGQTCLGCNATNTPEWRRGPLGPRTLCNACGLVYAKLIKKRNSKKKAQARDRKEGSKNGVNASNNTGDDSELASSDSDGESLDGSPDRRSELGDKSRRE